MGIELCKDLNALHPKVKELALQLLEACKKAGLDILITETYRTMERQDYLYAQGRTRAGNIVTNSPGKNMSSYHQWRLAFDVVNNSKTAPYDPAILAKVGAIGQKLGLEWGGSWQGFKDYPHFQYTFGLSIEDLRTGKRPPTCACNEGDYEIAVDRLVTKGIISTPSAWKNLTQSNPIYVEMLLFNMGKYIDPTITTYQEGVQRLVQKQIISYPDAWLNQKNYPIQNVKRLILLAAQKL
ncbi:hypothetical protein CS063_08330 [Sporanaerobium hydrogeniformans]|uniref:Uncharacterized protein n=1 Tax=Sporanaerobium hydrogeniformans TaxID=3072179 RepID=A0AC61DDA0_9FIRM|nr:M15 family metallopeptidase [Sporanaerobium hydrogeniformans]PHV70765.1 hypothetical protein CS063_08330 [Sporanaerobium hydrogeniformans]